MLKHQIGRSFSNSSGLPFQKFPIPTDLMRAGGPAGISVADAGFCGARIQPDCLRIGASGAHVSLSIPVDEWLAMFANMGRVLHLTRNAISVLGRLGEMPVFARRPANVLAQDATGTHVLNLAEHASLWAFREESVDGVLCGFETQSTSGSAIERIVPAAPGNWDLLLDCVSRHQAPPGGSNQWFPANHVWSARRRAGIAARVPFFRERLARGSTCVKQLEPRVVAKVLKASASEKLPIRVVQYYQGSARTLRWTPGSWEEGEGPGNIADFFHGGSVGLHLNHNSAATAWLWSGKCSSCSGFHWSIELGDEEDCVGLALMGGDDSIEPYWRELVTAAIREECKGG